MVTAERIRELLDQRPFRPFQLCLSDGSKHLVPRPESAKVFGGRVFIGVASPAGSDAGEAVRNLAILDITRVEEELAPRLGRKEPQ
jgi:hypothetical protein